MNERFNWLFTERDHGLEADAS